MSRILAIDLGKFKSVTCLLDTTTNETEFWTMSTDRRYLKAVLKRYKPDLVVIESCTIAGWVHDVCTAKGHKLLICNPNQEAWKWKHIKRKTDRDDALKIAKLAALDQLIPVYMPSERQREYRRLVKYRTVVRGRGVRIKNNIRAIFQRRGLAMVSGRTAWSLKRLDQIEQHRKPLCDCRQTSCGAANWTWSSASWRVSAPARSGREEASRAVGGRQTSPAPRNHSRRRSQNRRSRRGLFGRSSTIQKCAAGLVVCGSRPSPISVGLDGPTGTNPQTRAAVAADRLGGGGLDHADATIRGPKRSIKESAPTEKPQEESHHRRRSQASGPLLGDAVARTPWNGATTMIASEAASA